MFYMLWYFIQYLAASICLLLWEQAIVAMKVIRSSKKNMWSGGNELLSFDGSGLLVMFNS